MAVKQSPASVMITDTDGNIEYVNPKFTQLTGYTAEEAIGQNPSMLKSGVQPDTYYRELWETITADREWRGELCNKKKSGELYWESVSISPIKNSSGEITHYLAVKEDITDRRQAEEARARLNVQLKAKNKELEQIVYVASHDLRSPLVNIDGYGKELELAIDELRSAFDSDKTPTEAFEAVVPLLAHDIPEALRFIRTSASKMDALLNGLLKLSRSGRAALTIDSLDMNELMAQVVDACKFQIKDAGAELDIGDLPPCKGDAVQVNQVFSNLLGNALQYLDPERPGAIRIGGRVEGERSIYFVEDNGVGIAPAHRQSIFEIFHRLDPAKSKGEGLGLTIVQQILGRLSGYIWVESKLGEGSRFYVALPSVQINQ